MPVEDDGSSSDDAAAAAKKKSEEDGVEDSEEEEADKKEGEAEAKKTRKEVRPEWELLNDNKAIWLRPPSDVEADEYQTFYKALSKDWDESLTWSHFRAEGDVEFRALLYIPKHAPYEFYDKYYEKGPQGTTAT